MMDAMVFRNEFEQVSALALTDLTYEMQCCLFEIPAIADLCSGNFLTICGTAKAMAIAFETGRRVCLFEAAEAVSNPAGTNELSMEQADWRRSPWNGQRRILNRLSSRLGNPETTQSHANRRSKAVCAHTVLVLAEGCPFTKH